MGKISSTSSRWVFLCWNRRAIDSGSWAEYDFFLLFSCRPLLLCCMEFMTGEHVQAVQMLYSPSAVLVVQHQLICN